ncbi:hypothetical protein A9Q84_16610 [Halobacteriovorax marinus]|uniref:Uncharacterized protein n=1 Tax=Halobacteriovorax marinus TaxID=97084 RepID=A0A1Y5F4R1_9BACT|nr:hypothetical protein A9Q84_16610 [Halobacteriovorax marinus]
MNFKVLLYTLLLFISSNAVIAKFCDCNGKSGQRWINSRHSNDRSDGGCVASGAYVSENVFIAKTAKVCGNNYIEGSRIKIYGDALITGHAEIIGSNIRIGEGAVVGGTAILNDNLVLINDELNSGTHSNKKFNGFLSNEYQEHVKNIIRIEELSAELGDEYIDSRQMKMNSSGSTIKSSASYVMKFEGDCKLKVDYNLKDNRDSRMKVKQSNDLSIDFIFNKVVEHRRFHSRDSNKLKQIRYDVIYFKNDIGYSSGDDVFYPSFSSTARIKIFGNFSSEKSIVNELGKKIKAISNYCYKKP